MVLGCGSIYNHSAEANVGYRRVRIDGSSQAVQGLSVCYYAKRDIAPNEEMLCLASTVKQSIRNYNFHQITAVGVCNSVSSSFCYKNNLFQDFQVLSLKFLPFSRISYGKTWWSSRGIHDATAAPQTQLLLPSSAASRVDEPKWQRAAVWMFVKM